MRDRFFALPVMEGDSFYLERNIRNRSNVKILVDGGKHTRQNRAPLSRLLAPITPNIDVMVCTHADADHIQGLIEVLRANNGSTYNFSVEELWLPAQWLVLVEFVIGHSSYKDLRDTIRKYTTNDMESIGELEEIDSPYLDANEDKVGSTLPKDIVDGLTDKVLSRGAKSEISKDILEFKNKLSDIVRLLIMAFHRKVKCRFFRHTDTEVPTGGEWFLRPANAIEVSPHLRKRKPTIMNAITACNEQSLVFHSPVSPEPDSESYVLFSADSTFSFAYKPRMIEDAIVTIPHHGSNAHPLFYSWIHKKSATTVRSDRIKSPRPCPDYIALKKQKYCTVCNNQTSQKQIEFTGNKSGWKLQCKCKSSPCRESCVCV
ncbi:hypothetical protein DA096_26285 [Vibrio rotiferianus]|uniref:MBL fold metallo-hydrolase n=1 Tax=Vibrio rotiferianus TaxID=190895 RepID=UPI001110B4E1|nr:MBL fold metallo-hydrolase [Vibrio rotiferianus]TMX39744.1 hypothetical protein DA095_09330 [Vibrio rotiferianus]TMX57859.1 hypothetical protein DA096_26285 [Vibrio rotiferianus]TMX59142.1 hypothetical protein DA093_03410 [Vibrio rotiferianus]